MKIGLMLTGGMDSTTMLYKAVAEKHEIYPMTVDYGHVAFPKQIEMISYHLNKLEKENPDVIFHPLKEIKISFENKENGLFQSEFLPTESNPLEEWNDMRYKSFLVEGRNSIMVLYCMAFASKNQLDELWAGYIYGKEEWQKRHSVKLLLGDNSPQFVHVINILAQMGFSHWVRFRAPYYDTLMDKEEVYQLGKNLGVDFEKTYSCYFIPACNKCDNCLLRSSILTNS